MLTEAEKYQRVNCFTCKNYTGDDCDYDELCDALFKDEYSYRKDRPYYIPKEEKDG